MLDNAQYSYKSRFEEGKGTNPDELIAAAHAECFAMALSLILGEEGYTPNSLEVTAAVTLQPEKPELTASHLTLKAKATLSAFQTLKGFLRKYAYLSEDINNRMEEKINITGKKLVIVNLSLVSYFAMLYLAYIFKWDNVIIGVFVELLTIPFLLLQIVFLIVGINFLVKGFNIWVFSSVLLLAVCAILTIGSFFF